MKKDKKGFTLMELLAVIVILSVLILLAMPAVLRLMENSRKNSFLTEANSITRIAKNYYEKKRIDNEEVPSCVPLKTFSDEEFTNKKFALESGKVKYTKDINNNLEVTLWYTNNSYTIEGEKNIGKYTDAVKGNFSNKIVYSCGLDESNLGEIDQSLISTCNNDEYDFFVLEKNLRICGDEASRFYYSTNPKGLTIAGCTSQRFSPPNWYSYTSSYPTFVSLSNDESNCWLASKSHFTSAFGTKYFATNCINKDNIIEYNGTTWYYSGGYNHEYANYGAVTGTGTNYVFLNPTDMDNNSGYSFDYKAAKLLLDYYFCNKEI